MDLSNSLISTTSLLLKDKTLSPKVFVYSPSPSTFERWLLVIQVTQNGRAQRSSGSSKSFMEAYAKALSEMGELLIIEAEKLYSRCGIAGSFFMSRSISRAKCELLERDAFFFHYRNRLPFSAEPRELSEKGLLAYELSTADPTLRTFLVTDRMCASGQSECLLFGCATNEAAETAIEKAIQEYSAIYLNHQRHPDRCKLLANSSEKIPVIMDRHHAASRDPRNIERFRSLCSNRGSVLSPRKLDGLWEIQTLPSPIRALAFARVSHPSLIKLTFDIPEADEKDLLHPFW